MFTSSGSTFGSGNAFSANNNSASSPFGTKQASPSPGLFGNSATNNTQSTGLFGNNQQQPATGGLFNNNSSQNTNTSSGLFGSANNQANTSSGGLFGNNNNNSNQASSTNGVASTNVSSPAGGLFGNSSGNNNASSGGLFGAKPATSNQFGTSSNQTPSTGLFGNNSAQAKPTGGLFGSSNTTKPSLFGNSSTTSSQPPGNLFGNSSNLNNTAAGTPAKQYNFKDLPKSLTDSIKSNKTTNNSTGSRKRSISNANSIPGSVVNARSSLLERFSARFNTFTADKEFSAEGLFSPKKDLIQSALVPDQTTTLASGPKRSFKSFSSGFSASKRRGPNLSATSDFLRLELDPSRTEARRLKIFGESGGAQKVRILGREPETVSSIKDNTEAQAENLNEKAPEDKNGPTEEHKAEQETESKHQEDAPAASEDVDYWCSPSINELSSFSLRQLSEVPDFAIGRKGYGTIHFELPVDLTAFWSDLSGYLFGNVVRFNRNKTVEVYPNGSVPLGTGLNVPATITLEKVFPTRKNGKKKLDNLTVNDGELRIFVKRLKELNDMEFVAYDPINGSWTFKVEHFSIWGLVDDDVVVVDAKPETSKTAEEKPKSLSIAPSATVKVSKGPFQTTPQIPSKRIKARNSNEDTFVFRKRRQDKSFNYDTSFRMPGSFILDDDEDEEDLGSYELLKEENNILEKNEDLSSDDDLVLENEQIPSNFDYEGEDSLLEEDELAGYQEKQFEPTDVEARDFEYLNNDLNLPVSEDWDQQLELSSHKSSAFNEAFKATTRADAPFSKGFSPAELDKLLFGDFTKSLKPKECIEKNQKAEKFTSFKFFPDRGLIIKDSISDSSVVTNQVSSFFDDSDQTFIKAVFKEHIKQSKIAQRKNSFPLVAPNKKLDFKFITKVFESHPEFKVTSIWKLASVIFDARDLPGEVQNVKDSGVINRVLDIKHREGLLGWLTNEIQDEIDSQFSKSSDSFEKIFLSLVLNNISDASKFAFKSQNAHLSVLITLLGSNDPEVRYSATKQIEYWQNNSILQTIPINLLKIYYLLKGDPIHSDYYIDVLENLSWKARLSLLLSYGDINQSLSTLLTTFIESKASSDIPDIDRTQFLLLKLFVSKQSDKYDLKEIFTSLNNGGKLDVSLQWYIFEILIRSTKQLTFGAGDSNSVVGDELTSLYAEQLISSELYQEGIFVLSHLHDDEQVNSLISKLIAVNIEKFSKIDGLLHNLTTLLKVPTRLIIESKALYYSSTGNIWKEVSYFLDAENFEEAHKTIINKVAPAAVINNGPKLKFLEELIARFPEQHSIKDWNIGLLVYKNYIRSIRFNNESSLRYLVDNLPHVKQSNFKIKVAVRLMSKKVATRLVELSRSEGQSLLELDKQKILKLPLGEDAPSFAKDFAVEYFKQILTGVYN